VPPVVSANLSQKRSRTRAAERMKRILGRTVVALIAALAALYVGDSVVWRIRVATGGGMGKVTVSNMTALPLKDNKEEYFWNGNSEPLHLPSGRRRRVLVAAAAQRSLRAIAPT